MIDKIIKERLKEIDDSVKDLKEPVKSLAAKKLIDKLFGADEKEAPTSKAVAKTQKKQAHSSSKNLIIKVDEEKDKKMLNVIKDRTQYPEIHKLEKSIDRALFVLKIMKELDYDGLNPSQILKILTNTFRVKTNLPAISMALINDKYYTLKEPMSYKGTKANNYKIMQSGEDYIGRKLQETIEKTGDANEPANADPENGSQK